MRKPPINIVEAQAIATTLFGLSLPLTLDQLKKTLRAKQAQHHPDKNPGQEEAAAEQFKAIMIGYEKLVKCMAAFSESDFTEHTTRTEDGRLLSDLGIGLGPLVNGVDCTFCNHKGYSITFEKSWIVCDDCDAEGNPFIVKTCLDCKGTGKFALRSKRVVECRNCQGKGTVKIKKKSQARPMYRSIFGDFYGFNGPRCESCWGTKKKEVDDKLKPHYHTCGNCKGSGETRIFNPVIRRGALNGKRK